MKSFVTWLVAAGLVASLATSPALATVYLEDHFTNGEQMGTPDTFGNIWLQGSGGTVPLVDGRAIFDPSENNPTTTTDPFTGEEIAAAHDLQPNHRFRGPNFLPIPPASSGMMLELTAEVMDRGEESTPIYNPFHEDPEEFNATHSDIDVAEFRLTSGGSELYVPAFGGPFASLGAAKLSGNYFTGFVCEGAGGAECAQDPNLNFAVDSGVPLPGFGESHLIRSRIRSLPTGHANEAIVDVSTDGGASYTRIGRSLFPYFWVNGADAENPGFFVHFQYTSRGFRNCCLFDDGNRFDEGEFSADFIKIESVQLAPPDKGDMDLDGDTDFDDIDDFVLGLNDPALYRSTFWVESSQNGDIDMDGDQDFDDISGFVALLSGGGASASQNVPEPSTFMLAAIGLLTLVRRFLFQSKGRL